MPDRPGSQHQPVSVSLFTVVRKLSGLYGLMRKQEQQFQINLQQVLPATIQGNPQIFSPGQMIRFTKYYQLALNVICGNFYQLAGHQLSEKDHQRILLLSVLMPLADDLFDDHRLPYDDITRLVTQPEQYRPVGEADQLIKTLYLELLSLVPRRDQFMQHLQEGTQWQKQSLKQLEENITEQELYDITYNKSYYSLQLFYDALDQYPPGQLQPMFYALAGLMQLVNDAFDVWKDTQQGVHTLLSLYRNYDRLQYQFLAEISLINQELSQLNYTRTAKANFAITIHALHAMGWISLQHLKKATVGVRTMADLKLLSRKELVCDMDTLPQLIKWTRLVRRFTNYHETLPPANNSYRPAFTATFRPAPAETATSPTLAE